jgi:hypothetical protein
VTTALPDIVSESSYLNSDGRLSLYWPTSPPLPRNHSVCGSNFTVLTLFREDRAFMLCKIYSEIAMALVQSLQALEYEATAKCCRVGAPACEDGGSALFAGSQVILLDAIELYPPDAHVWGPVMLPARNTEVHPLVRTRWLPADTSKVHCTHSTSRLPDH